MRNLAAFLMVGLFLVMIPALAAAGEHPWGVEGNRDSDRDGIMDYDDKCPGTKYCCFVDSQGCPIDKDEDGVCDGYWDKCPDTPKGAWVDENGCPKDTDGDGVLDGLDKCPDTPQGVKVDQVGCPLDSDGDGVYDYLDKCPDTPRNLKVDPDGCPIQVKMSKTVFFDTNKADLKPAAVASLREVAKFMADFPETKAVITGHADNRASDQYNLKLSRRRAEMVRDFLAGQPGLDGSRLQVEALGESQPAATNDTPAGMEKNRRVEIVVSPAYLKR